MYQLEVKHQLVKHLFSPSDGWEVLVDIDAMERAKGPQHKPDKKEKVLAAELALKFLGVDFGSHKEHGRVDIYAAHPEKGVFLIEVEGKSSKQKEQAMYSAIGQIVLMMNTTENDVTYGLAVPDLPEWEHQIQKIPGRVKNCSISNVFWCLQAACVKFKCKDSIARKLHLTLHLISATI
ncbi:MAG: hypothetical protein KKA54_16075 [Proteobacteria bacterium]|nr:hypothetical protein [Pseudomonadota bacterium]